MTSSLFFSSLKQYVAWSCSFNYDFYIYHWPFLRNSHIKLIGDPLAFWLAEKKKKQDLRIHSDWLKNLDNLSSDRLNLPNLSSDWLKIFLTKVFSDWLKNLLNLSSDWLENLSFLTFPLIGLKSSFETVSELCKIKLKTNTKERNYLFPFPSYV